MTFLKPLFCLLTILASFSLAASENSKMDSESERFQHLFQDDFKSFVLRPKDGEKSQARSGISLEELWTILPELDRATNELAKVKDFSRNRTLDDECTQMSQNADLLASSISTLKTFLLKNCLDGTSVSVHCHSYRDRQENAASSARDIANLFLEKCVSRLPLNANDYPHTSLKFGPLGSFQTNAYSESATHEKRNATRGMFAVEVVHVNDVLSVDLESQVGVTSGGVIHELQNDWNFYTRNQNFDLGIKQSLRSTAESFFIQDEYQVKRLSELSGDYHLSPKTHEGETFFRGVYQPSLFFSTDSHYSGFLHLAHIETGVKEDRLSSESFFSLSFAKFVPNANSFSQTYQEWGLRRVLRKVFLGYSIFESEIGLMELRDSQGNAKLLPHFKFQWLQPSRSALYRGQQMMKLKESHFHRARLSASWGVKRTFFSPQAQSLQFEAEHTLEFDAKNKVQLLGHWRQDRASPDGVNDVILEDFESAFRFESEVRERMWFKVGVKIGQSILSGKGVNTLPVGLWARPDSSLRFVEFMGALIYEF